MLYKLATAALLWACLAAAAVDIDGILAQMTLAEKVGQMVQLDLNLFLTSNLTVKPDAVEEYITKYGVGSVFNSPFAEGVRNGQSGWTAAEWRAVLAQLQQPSKYPLIFALDSIHGATYVKDAALFPQEIALAATFDPSFATAAGRVTARDTRAAGVPWIFAPVLDLAVQPLWARFYETFGEDPYLASQMAAAIVQGLQYEENDGGLPKQAAACMKHFIAYGNPESGHDRSTSSVPDRLVKQLYVPAFRSAVNAGVMSAMESYNEVGGVPLVSHYEYLQNLLRGDLGFKGLLVTDYQEIEHLQVFHKAADSEKEAVRIAIQDTSIDMSMVPLDVSFADMLIQLVEEGTIPESRIDDSVRRILQMKDALGLFEDPVVSSTDPNVAKVGQASDWQQSLDAARESITLLKNNNGILPLDNDAKILVTGPTCNSKAYQTGGWSIHWQGAKSDAELPVGSTMLEGIQAEFGAANVVYFEGVAIDAKDTSAINMTALEAAAADVDVIVACVGEPNYTEKPGDINQLDLPAGQTQYVVETLKALGKPIVLVLVEGRPRLLNGMKEASNAVLHTYLPGPMGGQALAEILSGEVNPSGVLPFTYPKYAGAIRPYHRKPSLECVDANGIYGECPVEWEFGEGLSYTTFSYSNFQLDKTAVQQGQTLTVSVDVTNSGNRAGKHTVLLFLSDMARRVTPEYKLLKGFKKVSLAPHQTTTVTFTLTMDDLSYVNIESYSQLEAGDFRIGIGYKTDCRSVTWFLGMCKSVQFEVEQDYNPVCDNACAFWDSNPFCTNKADIMQSTDCQSLCKQQNWSWNYVDCLRDASYSGSCSFNKNCRNVKNSDDTSGDDEDGDDDDNKVGVLWVVLLAIGSAVVGGVIVGVTMNKYFFDRRTGEDNYSLLGEDKA